VRTIVPMLLLSACDLPEPATEAECEERMYALPTEDGGDPSSVYIGCHPPKGWVTTLPALETAHTADTGDSVSADHP